MITIENYRKLIFARRCLRRLRDEGINNIQTLPVIQPALDAAEQAIQIEKPDYELVRVFSTDISRAILPPDEKTAKKIGKLIMKK
jgi:hypothetical protein